MHIGYVIFHKGYDANYIVINWWSHGNMLRLFAYRAPLDSPHTYTLVENGLHICVWDMLVHHFERNAYVHHIMSSGADNGLHNYMNNFYEQNDPSSP